MNWKIEILKLEINVHYHNKLGIIILSNFLIYVFVDIKWYFFINNNHINRFCIKIEIL